MKGLIYVTGSISDDAFALLRSRHDVVVGYGPAAVAIDEVVDGLDGILVRTQPVDGALLAKAGKLKVIARRGVGVDNVDVEAATRHGIPVLITATANARTVAEHVFGLALALQHNIVAGDNAVRCNDFAARDRYVGHDLFTATLGVIGLGRIGREVVRIARDGFGMSVVVYDPFAAPTATVAGVTAVNALDTLLERSDIVTVHVPLSEVTRGLIGEAALRRMTPGAMLIQTSRGGVVDETALAKALANGHLAGAGIDVFEHEPPPANHPLFAMDNVVLTPHSSGLTEEAVQRMSMAAVLGIIDVLDGVSTEELLTREDWRVANPDFAATSRIGDGTWA